MRLLIVGSHTEVVNVDAHLLQPLADGVVTSEKVALWSTDICEEVGTSNTVRLTTPATSHC